MFVINPYRIGIWGLYVYAFFSCLSSYNYAMGLRIALVVAVYLFCFRNQEFRESLQLSHGKVILWAIGLFSLATLISGLASQNVMLGIERTWEYAYHMSPLLMSPLFIREKRQLKTVLLLMCTSLLISDFTAIYQYVYLGDVRAKAFNPHYMTFAGFLLLMIPLMLMGILHGIPQGRIKKIGLGIVLGLSFFALLANGTRGAWLAVAVSTLMLFIYTVVIQGKGRKAAGITLMMVFLLLLVFLQQPQFRERMLSSVDVKHETNIERVLAWDSAWQMFYDHPFLGVGPLQWSREYTQKYINPVAKEALGHAHNNYLHILAEQGIVGFATFIAMFGSILLSSIRGWREDKNLWALAMIPVTVGLLVQGFTEFNFGKAAVMRMYMFILGIQFVWARERIGNTL